MKDIKRSIRRHHIERLKKSRSDYWYWGEKSEKHLGMIVNTPRICSCWKCKRFDYDNRSKYMLQMNQREKLTEAQSENNFSDWIFSDHLDIMSCELWGEYRFENGMMSDDERKDYIDFIEWRDHVHGLCE